MNEPRSPDDHPVRSIIASPPEAAVVGWGGQPDANQPVSGVALLLIGWECFKRDWKVFALYVLMGLLAYAVAIVMVLSAIGGVGWVVGLSERVMDFLSYFGVFVIGILIALLTMSGYMTLCLASVRHQAPTVATFFSSMKKSWSSSLRLQVRIGLIFGLGFAPLFLGVIALSWVIHVSLKSPLGMLMLVVTFLPLVVVMLRLVPAALFVVDLGMKPRTAVTASWKVTTGHRREIFILSLLSMLLLIGGTLTCLVGLVVALPVTCLALAALYLQLKPPEISQPATVSAPWPAEPSS